MNVNFDPSHYLFLRTASITLSTVHLWKLEGSMLQKHPLAILLHRELQGVFGDHLEQNRGFLLESSSTALVIKSNKALHNVAEQAAHFCRAYVTFSLGSSWLSDAGFTVLIRLTLSFGVWSFHMIQARLIRFFPDCQKQKRGSGGETSVLSLSAGEYKSVKCFMLVEVGGLDNEVVTCLSQSTPLYHTLSLFRRLVQHYVKTKTNQSRCGVLTCQLNPLTPLTLKREHLHTCCFKTL